MRKLRLLLFPFAGIYYVITLVRNKLYDTGIFKSIKYDVPVICVGNLSVGGTGKSPMTEYIIRLLRDEYKVATLSRGYGRKTRGYKDVSAQSIAANVGDEPLQFAQKFNDIQVAVCEDRQSGMERLLSKEPPPQVIILDDAYQHRKVTAGFNVLLTSYGDLYKDDYLLPAGNLREPRGGALRADVVVVTKCPDVISADEQRDIRSSLAVNAGQEVYFSKIAYDSQIRSQDGEASLHRLKTMNVTLVTGIANPKPLLEYLDAQGLSYFHKSYGDHHNFSAAEITDLEGVECILTTEKDYVRLRPLLSHKQLYYLPIRATFMYNGEDFSMQVKGFVESL